jgi:hypothetical protein
VFFLAARIQGTEGRPFFAKGYEGRGDARRNKGLFNMWGIMQFFGGLQLEDNKEKGIIRRI